MAETFDIKSELIEDCRICGAPLDNEIFDIFSILLDNITGSSETMYEAFQTATGISISPDDSPTRSVCGTCYTRLKFTIQLRQNGKKSHDYIVARQHQLHRFASGITTIKGKTVQVSGVVRRCLLCLELNAKLLTEIRGSIDSNFENNDEPSILSLYELVIGISVPEDVAFLCQMCIESLRESFFLHLRTKGSHIMAKPSVETSEPQTQSLKSKNVCKICSNDFVTHKELEAHLEKHYIEDNAVCSICLIKYEDFSTYQEHLPCGITGSNCELTSETIENNKTRSPEESDQLLDIKLDENCCGYCSKVLADQNELTQHLKNDHSKNYCYLCKIFYLTQSQFCLHMNTHITDNYYFCRICYREFNNLVDYEYHALVDHFKHICSKCTFMGKTKISFKPYKWYPECGDGSNTCQLCSKRINTFRAYITHMRCTHYVYSHYNCCFCERPFKSLISYITHMHKHHQVIPKDIKSQAKISKKHLRVHKNDRRKTCKICLQQFNNVATYLEHSESEHPDKICKICSKVFITNESLVKHVKRHFNKRTNLCNICAKRFPDSKSYRLHRRKTHKDYFCDICSDISTFSDRQRFITHMDNHITNTYYICKTCLEEFDEIESYRSHVRNLHKKTICEFCSYTSETNVTMRRHFSRHKQRQYGCKYCEKRFFSQREVHFHLPTHKQFKCDICGLRMKYLSSLSKHKKYTHAKWKCKICLESFNSRRAFRTHIFKTENFYFICEKDKDRCLCKICIDDFDTIQNCEVHLRCAHEKNICQVCSTVFILHTNLPRHMRTAHGISKLVN